MSNAVTAFTTLKLSAVRDPRNQEEPDILFGGRFYACLACVGPGTGRLMADLRESDSERQLRLLTDKVAVAIAYCDMEARYKFANRHYAERHGFMPEQVVGKHIREVVGERTWAIFEPYFREGFAGREFEFELEVDLPYRAGQPQFVHYRYEPEWRDGKVVGLLAVITNITDLKHAEQRLRASEVTFRQLVENSPFGIYVVDADFRLVHVSAGAEKVFENVRPVIGCDLAEALRRIWSEPFASEVIGRFRHTLLTGEQYRSPSTVERRNDTGAVEAYDWKIERLTMPDGRRGIVAHFYDLSERLRYEAALRASKDRLQFALDAALLGWWQHDPLQGGVSGDARFKEIFDVTADEVSVDDLMKRVHPDDTARLWADREAALDPTNPKLYAHEYRIRRRNGEIRWVEGRGFAHFEGTGPARRAVSLTGTVQDITERKEREEKEYFLMREVNHRAKNMLNVVQVIAHQTAAKSPEDFIERFCERIQALSANQDLLVRNDWSGVEIEDLVRAQLAPLADLIGSRIIVQGLSFRLKPVAAQAIGLALHELATNAGKYGALSTAAGRVDISWRIDGDTLTISWTERDGPPVSTPTRRGFGTVVTEAMVGYSVDGTVDLDYAPSGLTWRLTCPAARSLEPWEREQISGDGKADDTGGDKGRSVKNGSLRTQGPRL
jgi:PAS domain S-box-containing protein